MANARTERYIHHPMQHFNPDPETPEQPQGELFGDNNPDAGAKKSAAQSPEVLAMLREKAARLPLLPGVYLMYDTTGTVIYVGKSKRLKNRVSSYFHGEHLPKVQAMADKVADFHVIVVSTEFDALVLENSLIKQHQPHYNILLRDGKGYPFVRIDLRDPYPRFELVGKVAEDGAKYFGPFGGRSATTDVLSTLSRTFGLPDCSRKLPQDIGKERPCLKRHIHACDGWCEPGHSQQAYKAAIDQAVMVLSGRTSDLKQQLQQAMEEASEALRFEQAAEYRDRMRALDNLAKKQQVIVSIFADMDAVGFFRGAKTCFTVLHYTNGSLSGKDYELIDEPVEEDPEAVSKLVFQYYTRTGHCPKMVLLPLDTGDRDELSQYLTQLCGHKVSVEVPKRGDRARMTEDAALNAREEVQRATTAQQRQSKTAEWLQKTLQLPTFPRRIEAFDISNLGNFGIVAAMTVFIDGKPRKRDYRKFRMKETTAQNDYASMHEAVYRRFARALVGDEKFGEIPDLLLIDGGQSHAAVAEGALQELGMLEAIPVYGMVKDDHHRTRALINSAGEEIGIVGNQAVFAYIGTIQEETHRFAIEYQRSLRRGNIGSKLDEIPGVGEKRRAALLQKFKTVKAVSKASVEELQAVVPKSVAIAIYGYFHKDQASTPEPDPDTPELDLEPDSCAPAEEPST